jgi:hypothetical protein
LLTEIAALRERSSVAVASPVTAVQSGPRPLLVTGVIALSFASLATGFGGGFIVGQRSRASAESMAVSQREPIAEPQPAPAAVEDPQPVAPAQMAVSVSAETVSSPEPIAAPAAPPRAAPAVESGRLLVRSTPAGATVVIDGRSRGVTPLELPELAFGTYAIAVSHSGHETRRRRVTLSERRPARSIDVELPPTSVPAQAVTATGSTGSLHVASRPPGAQVFVDDTLIGTTPLLMSKVAVGSRSVRVQLPGYQTWTTAVQIAPSSRLRVAASLEP